MENSKRNAAVEAAQVEAVNEVDNQEATEQLLPMSAYHGQDADDVTRQLKRRSDFTDYANLVVTNVIDKATDSNQGGLIVVVNKNLPQYVRNADTGLYELGATRNLFTTRSQIAAILKGQSDPAMAATVMVAPVSVLLVLFAKSRISVLSHLLAKDEIFCNPYASRMADKQTVNEHDRYEYFPYELSFGHGLSLQDQVFMAELTEKYKKQAEQ